MQAYPAPQDMPQAPQFSESVIVLAQYAWPPSPVHTTSDPAQVAPHTPLEQSCPAPHACPQAPQLETSVCRLAQMGPHAVCVLGQIVTLPSPVVPSVVPSVLPSSPVE